MARLLNKYLAQVLTAEKEAFDQIKNEHGDIVYIVLPGESEQDDDLQMAQAGDEFVIRIRGIIHDYHGVSVTKIIEALDEANPTNIRVLIASPGGHVEDGMALYADLRARAKDGARIVTEARGVVGSAASLIFLAGDERRLVEGSMFMIHGAWFQGMNAKEWRAWTADLLRDIDAIDAELFDNYERRLDVSAQQLQQWIDTEQLLTTNQAIEAGIGELYEGSGTAPVADTSNDGGEGGPSSEMLAQADLIMNNMRRRLGL